MRQVNIVLLVIVAFLMGLMIGLKPIRVQDLITQSEINHEISRMIAMPAPPAPIKNVVPLRRISAYNAVPRQTDGDPSISSCGANLPRQVAVSRDLFFDSDGRKHLCGAVVTVISDRGEVFENYVVWDTMHQRFTETVDVLWHNNDEGEAYAFGITTGHLIFH